MFCARRTRVIGVGPEFYLDLAGFGQSGDGDHKEQEDEDDPERYASDGHHH